MSDDRQTYQAYVNTPGAADLTFEEYLDVRQFWRHLGGSFHGPNVETATIPEAKLLRLLLAVQDAGLVE